MCLLEANTAETHQKASLLELCTYSICTNAIIGFHHNGIQQALAPNLHHQHQQSRACLANHHLRKHNILNA